MSNTNTVKNSDKVMDNINTFVPDKPVVVRFGPSPTGFLHIGGIRTALYNYLFAKKHGGKFILRIEDTDEKRFNGEAEDYIRKALDWVGITTDEDPWKGGDNGPYRQSERDYTKYAQFLVDAGHAYYSFDTEDDIAVERAKDKYFSYNAKTRGSLKNSLNLSKNEVDALLASGTPYVIRFKVPADTTVTFDDIVHKNVSINSNQLDDKVLIKSTGMVSYHMANVCDDHDMGVTYVLRGEEWVNSTPFHILLYTAFGWDMPTFAHLPAILKPDGKGKLSKRDGIKLGIPVFPFGGEGVDDNGTVIKYKGFKDEGYDPEAVVNFLLMLGWAPDNDKEVYKMDDMIKDFSLDRVHKAGAKFDINKAKWFNATHVQNASDDVLLNHIDKGNTYTYSDDKLSLIVDLCKKRSSFKSDMQTVADIFFKPLILTDKDKDGISPDFKTIFTLFLDKVDTIDFTVDGLNQTIADLCTDNGVKMGKIMPSLRMALTGNVPGPDLKTTMVILGKDETVNRIKNSL